MKKKTQKQTMKTMCGNERQMQLSLRQLEKQAGVESKKEMCVGDCVSHSAYD